jgi:hypothetical protein
MSWWANQPLASQRHHCLEAARKYINARAHHAKLWEAHEAAQARAKELGVTVVVTDRSRYTGQVARLVLPTEAPLNEAAADRSRASREFQDALMECPAVMAEVFAMLGARP